MPNERHYNNELNLESVGINQPFNMQAEQSVLGAVLLKPDTLTDLVEITSSGIRVARGDLIEGRFYADANQSGMSYYYIAFH